MLLYDDKMMKTMITRNHLDLTAGRITPLVAAGKCTRMMYVSASKEGGMIHMMISI